MPKTKYSHSDVSGEPFHHSPGAAAGVGGGAGPSEGPARPPGEAQVGPVHSGPRGGAPHLADAHVRTLRVGVGITPSFSPRVPQSQPVCFEAVGFFPGLGLSPALHVGQTWESCLLLSPFLHGVKAAFKQGPWQQAPGSSRALPGPPGGSPFAR